MPVVVRNELTEPWIFEASRGSRQILPGEVVVISDEEWASVITAKRGPGRLHALSSDPAARIKSKFEYFDPGNASVQVLYLGQADQSALDADATWTIKKFTWIIGADGTAQVSLVEVLDSVAWSSRAALPW